MLRMVLAVLYCLIWASQLGRSHSVDQVIFNGTFSDDPRSELVVPQDSPWHLARLAQQAPLSQQAILRDGGEILDSDSILRLKSFDWEFPRLDSWGTNVFVYVLDSGVYGGHIEFEPGQVLEGAATGTGRDGEGHRDEQGHGTGVASLIVGKNVGVAKSARIIPVKIAVNGELGEVATTAADVAAGLEWACKDWRQRLQENKDYRAIINISWIVKDRPEIIRWLREAIDLGVHVVIAAGNTDGISLCQTDLDNPDPTRWIRPLGQIGVGQIDYMNQFWYQSGPCVDVTAPSYYLPHADIGSREDYAYTGRTSQSAPLVTGVIAALITAGQPGHDMSPKQLRDLLLKDRAHGGYTYGGVMELPANTPDRIISSPILSIVPQ